MTETEWWESSYDALEMDEPEWLEKWGKYTEEIVNFWKDKNELYRNERNITGDR